MAKRSAMMASNYMRTEWPGFPVALCRGLFHRGRPLSWGELHGRSEFVLAGETPSGPMTLLQIWLPHQKASQQRQILWSGAFPDRVLLPPNLLGRGR